MSGFALDELQKWMHAALIVPQSGTAKDARTRLTTSPRLTAAEGLAIYQRSYALRIAACMREQFPALCHALGEDLFNDFVAEYIRDAPPESYTLYDLGRRFAGYLQHSRPDQASPEPWFDFMVDLAAFERLVFTVFDCDGSEGLPLATADTPQAALRVQPSLRVGQYRYPVAWYYHQIRDGASPEIPNAEHNAVAIVRKDYQTTTFPIAPTHAVFLQNLQGGASIPEALAKVAESFGYDLAEVTNSWNDSPHLLQKWIDAGVFLDQEAIEPA